MIIVIVVIIWKVSVKSDVLHIQLQLINLPLFSFSQKTIGSMNDSVKNMALQNMIMKKVQYYT